MNEFTAAMVATLLLFTLTFCQEQQAEFVLR
jgi:hypothetical protein